MSNGALYVVYATSDLYAFACGISIISLFEANKEIDSITVYIISIGLNVENIEKFKNIASKYGRNINIIDSRECDLIVEKYVSKYGEYRNYGKPYAQISWYRCILPEILPEGVKRCIYLGADTFVNGSLTELINLDMNQKIIGGVRDAITHYYRKRIGLKDTGIYCNSDVWLVDLNAWKLEGVSKKIFELAAGQKDFLIMNEQDVMNCVLQDKIFILPPKYNTMASYVMYDRKTILKMYGFVEEGFYDEITFEDSKNNPAIYHFAGNMLGRPWYRDSVHPQKKEYDEVYYHSPWKERKQEKSQIALPYRVQRWGYLHLPYWLHCKLGIVMQRYFGWSRYRSKG